MPCVLHQRPDLLHLHRRQEIDVDADAARDAGIIAIFVHPVLGAGQPDIGDGGIPHLRPVSASSVLYRVDRVFVELADRVAEVEQRQQPGGMPGRAAGQFRRSISTTESLQPFFARWYKVATPTTPPPITTARAWLLMSAVPLSLREKAGAHSHFSITRSVRGREQQGRKNPFSMSRGRIPPSSRMSTRPERSLLLHVPQTPARQADGNRSPAANAASSTKQSGRHNTVRLLRVNVTVNAPSATCGAVPGAFCAESPVTE
jgi:hypothetical protein